MARKKDYRTEHDVQTPITHEIDSFSAEQKRVRTLMASIGGNVIRTQDRIINVLFLVIIVSIFCIEIFTDLLPALLSVEIGILLVSVKIIWMIHAQARFQHFNFWVLNAIEQKLNALDARVQSLQKKEPKK